MTFSMDAWTVHGHHRMCPRSASVLSNRQPLGVACCPRYHWLSHTHTHWLLGVWCYPIAAHTHTYVTLAECNARSYCCTCTHIPTIGAGCPGGTRRSVALFLDLMTLQTQGRHKVGSVIGLVMVWSLWWWLHPKML